MNPRVTFWSSPAAPKNPPAEQLPGVVHDTEKSVAVPPTFSFARPGTSEALPHTPDEPTSWAAGAATRPADAVPALASSARHNAAATTEIMEAAHRRIGYRRVLTIGLSSLSASPLVRPAPPLQSRRHRRGYIARPLHRITLGLRRRRVVGLAAS